MGYSVVDVEDVPYTWGTFKFVRHHIGATAFGFAQIDFPPDKVGSEHDETESGPGGGLSHAFGRGTLDVDGETVEMPPGRYVLVPPDARRRPAAGPDGMSFLVIGGVPGRRLRALALPRGMIVRIALWRLDETTPSLDDLRERSTELEPLAAARRRARQRRGGADRRVRGRRGRRAPPPQLEQLRLLVGREPDLYEEFDTL